MLLELSLASSYDLICKVAKPWSKADVTKMKKTGNAHLVYGVEICVVVDATDDDRDDGME